MLSWIAFYLPGLVASPQAQIACIAGCSELAHFAMPFICAVPKEYLIMSTDFTGQLMASLEPHHEPLR
jgi:hypothetical protein